MARKKRKSPKVALGLLLVALIGIGACLYMWQQQPTEGGLRVSPRMVVHYEDGTEETITPSLLASVYYGTKKIVRIYTFWDVTATVDSATGTVNYTYSVWAQIVTSKMHVKNDTDLDIALGTTHTLGYSSWVDSAEIQNTVGDGTYTLYFHVNGTASSTVEREALSKSFSASVTATIKVVSNTLTITVAPKGIQAY